MLVHTGALRYKFFYREMILLRETFRRRRVFTQVPLHTEILLHRCFYMLIWLQYTLLYAHILLRRDSFTRTHFTQRHFDTRWQARLHANTYTAMFILCVFFKIHTCMLCRRDALNHTCFHTEIFLYRDTLHRDAFAQGCFHTQKCLFTHKHFYRQMILYWAIFHTDTRTNRGAVTKEWICTWGFYLRAFSRRHTIAWFPTADARMVQRVQQAYAKSQFHHRLWWSRRISWEKGGQHTHQHRNLTPTYDDRHVVRTGYVSWSSIHAALRSKRKVRNSQDWL